MSRISTQLKLSSLLGNLGGSFGYQVGNIQYGTLRRTGEDDDDDENDNFIPMDTHFLKSHYGTKNSKGKAICVTNVSTNADVILCSEKVGVLQWLIDEGIHGLDVKVLLADSGGQQDDSFKSTVRKLAHNTCVCVCRVLH